MNAPPASPLRRPGSRPPAMNRVRVMIVDDSLTVRTIFQRMVDGDPDLELASTASSGERAIAKIKSNPADVVLLDLEMPGIGGLKALPAILEAAPGAQVLVVSSLTQDGAEATLEALSNGAADTLLKPRPGGFNDEYRSQLLGKIKALGQGRGEPASSDVAGSALPRKRAQLHAPNNNRGSKPPQLIAIGASTGGIHALNLMLREFTPALDLPILITQHLPASFVPVFARQVEVASGRPTHIAEEGTQVRKGEIAIATGHGHMHVRRMAGQLQLSAASHPVASGCLPSVDPMLSSAAEACDGHVLAIMLSGMGRDGFEGAQDVVAAGGAVWAQDAETSAVWGMPGAVAKAGLATYVASPQALARATMEQLAQFSHAAK